MIAKVEIENFKAISKLSIEPGSINILVGRNNTGKSTVLEAIALACTGPTFKDTLGTDLLERSLERSGNKLLKFGASKGKVEIRLVTGDRKVLELMTKASLDEDILDQMLPKLKDSVVDEVRRKIEDLRERIASYTERLEHAKRLRDEEEVRFLEHRLSLLKREYSRLMTMQELEIDRRVQDYMDRTEIFIVQRFNDDITNIVLVGDYGYRVIVLRDKGLPVKLLQRPSDIEHFIAVINESTPEVIDKVIVRLRKDIPDLVNIRAKTWRSVYVSLSHGDNIWTIPLSSMGDGFKVLLEMYTLVYLTGNQGVVLMEEPEIKLHPGYMRLIVDMLIEVLRQGFQIQFFMTTHSIEFLRLLVERLREQDDGKPSRSKNVQIS